MLRLALIAFLAILQGGLLARAAQGAVLVGCAASAAASAAIPQVGTFATADACASVCFTQSIFNSLYNSTNCYCSNAPPSQSLLVAGQDKSILGSVTGAITESCSVTDLSAYAWSTLTFAGCATQSLLSSLTSSNYLGIFANPNGCFNAVANANAQLGVTASALLARASLTGDASAGANAYFCYRSNPSVLNPLGLCSLTSGLSTNRLYSFASSTVFYNAAGSQFVKRQEAARKRAAMFQPRTLCPADLTPCRISPGSGHYECMDTKNDLESCGGCLYGEMENLSAPVGADCSALPGVRLGGATCTAGKCEVSACRPGWMLSPGSDGCQKSSTPRRRR